MGLVVVGELVEGGKERGLRKGRVVDNPRGIWDI